MRILYDGESFSRRFTALTKFFIYITLDCIGNFHTGFLAIDIRIANFGAVDWRIGKFREDNCHFRTHAGTSGTIGFTILRICNDNLALLGGGKHAKQTKVQTLLATNAAIVINHRKPGNPLPFLV